MAPGVAVGRLARNAKDSMEISFLWAASSLSPGMPSSARKMSAEGPPVWEVSNGEAPPLPKPPPPEVSGRAAAAVAGRAGVALRADGALLVPGERRLVGRAVLRRGRVRVEHAQLTEVWPAAVLVT